MSDAFLSSTLSLHSSFSQPLISPTSSAQNKEALRKDIMQIMW